MCIRRKHDRKDLRVKPKLRFQCRCRQGNRQTLPGNNRSRTSSFLGITKNNEVQKFNQVLMKDRTFLWQARLKICTTIFKTATSVLNILYLLGTQPHVQQINKAVTIKFLESIAKPILPNR
eukprot:GHVU01069676.1.p1 GENE.GHVU01069676.1~~GHVU01069676.1.p1  ORF type:complete len:121 (+),score=1.35 GHVU01069676.1:45-407(+)